MNKKTIFKDNELHYKIEGNGKAIVLMHGFMESSEIWGDFISDLSKNFLVIAPDFPGHGKSKSDSEEISMNDLAESVLQILAAENIEKAFITGHSMGGYAACAFAELFPEKINGLCLLHSVPFADSDDKKLVRDATVTRIAQGQKQGICEEHAPKVFANDNFDLFSEKISNGLQIALSTDTKTIDATLIGMRNRQDRSKTIKNLKVPFLYIEGLKDNFIPPAAITSDDMPKIRKILSLKNSGHMGFIEEREKVSNFFKRNI